MFLFTQTSTTSRIHQAHADEPQGAEDFNFASCAASRKEKARRARRMAGSTKPRQCGPYP